jgi:hypothetical protein
MIMRVLERLGVGVHRGDDLDQAILYVVWQKVLAPHAAPTARSDLNHFV